MDIKTTDLLAAALDHMKSYKGDDPPKAGEYKELSPWCIAVKFDDDKGWNFYFNARELQHKGYGEANNSCSKDDVIKLQDGSVGCIELRVNGSLPRDFADAIRRANIILKGTNKARWFHDIPKEIRDYTDDANIRAPGIRPRPDRP